jgi:methionyl-tRNA synthetase
VLKKTKHWFILLDKFKDRLIDWIDKKNWKTNVVNFVKDYIKDLRPRSVTRDSDWGVSIPLPNAEGKIIYVWFEACIGYISATKEWAQIKGSPEKWKDYWCDPKTKLVNFIGKDNIPFHAVLFPAMTMGQNQPYKVVDELPANEFLMLEGRQFSKSDGWMIDLDDFFKRYTADQIRYTLAANAPESSDAEFTWHDFQNRCNGDLGGKYGNFVNRVLVFAKNNCNSKIPEPGKLEETDQKFLEKVKKLASQAEDNYNSFSLRRATQTIMELAQEGNVYFDAKQPWKAVKNPETKPSMETTIACCLECIKILALISSPIIPETAEKVWKMIGMTTPLSNQKWLEVVNNPIKSGQNLPLPEILFKKIEDEQIEHELEKLKKR